jgi:hypothetical protein
MAFEFHNGAPNCTIHGMIVKVQSTMGKSPLTLNLFVKFECGPLQSYKGRQFFFDAGRLAGKKVDLTIEKIFATREDTN